MPKLYYQIKLIEQIDQLIRLRSTGNPRALAQKINVSESTIYRLMEIIKEMGAPVKYSPTHQSYIYTKSVNFLCGFYTHALSPSEYKKVNGGYHHLKFITEKIAPLSKFTSKLL